MTDSVWDRMTVGVPEGELDGMRVSRFTVKPGTVQGYRLAMRGRACPPGEYTRLTAGDTFWMSDTPAEKRDHYEAVFMIETTRSQRPGGGIRVLINGLGLGMVLAAALSYEHVEHVDVVERDPRVIALIGPHYTRDPRVSIVHGDAYEVAQSGWANGTRWDVGWSDIWPELNYDDLADHARLNRSYGRRCTWHGCWGHEYLLDKRAADRRESARYEEWMS